MQSPHTPKKFNIQGFYGMALPWLSLWLCMLLTGSLFAAAPTVTVSDNGPTIPRYDIYEVTMAHTGTYTYPNDDVTITAVFTAPSAKTYTVGGFFYDNNVWKLRFAPMETGNWTWNLTFDNGSGSPYTTSGSFTSIPSSSSGFIRIHPRNSKRLMTEADGKPFYVNGFNGEFTFLPWNPSPMTCYIDSNQPLTFLPLSDLFKSFQRAGNNIVRCNMQAMTDYLTRLNDKSTGKNTWNISEGKRQDEFIQDLHPSGLKLMMAFYPWALPTSAPYDITSTGDAAAIVSMHKHMLNRFSAYVDVWEMGNEMANVTQPYMDLIASTVHANDPYDHILTVSYQQEALNESTLTAANTHTYLAGSNLVLDQSWINSSNSLKTGLGIWNGATFGTGTSAVYIPSVRGCYPTKPIFAGECGNAAPVGNYDPERYRIDLWTTITNESGPIFWPQNDSKTYKPSGGLSNMYMGSEEKGMSRVLMNLVKDLDPAVNSLYPSGVVVCTPSTNMRGYVMSSTQNIIGYFFHSNDHSTFLTNGQVKLPIPADGMLGQWIDPVTGNILQNFTVNSGTQTLSAPSFKCDIGLRIRPASSAPVLEFATASYTPREDQGSVTVTVNRSNSGTGAVSVQYSTSDGLAKAGQGYTAASGTLNWTDGDMTPKQIVIPLMDDLSGGCDKDFQMFLSNPTGGASLGGNDNALVIMYDAQLYGRPSITSIEDLTGSTPVNVIATGTTTFPFSYTITAINSPTSYGAVGLPAGLNLNPASGIISGTPTASGTFNVTLSAINASGTGTAIQPMIIIPFVLLPPVITSTLSASGTAGVAFSYTITATNYPTSYNATGLPTGSSINTTTGMISGTFIAAGTYPCTISAINSSGTGSATLILGVSGTAGIQFVYEPFNYAVTNNLSTAPDAPGDFGLTGTNWNTGANKVISPGLSYSGISSTGNAVQFTSSIISQRSIDMTAAPGGYTQVETDGTTRIGKPGCTLWVRVLMRTDVADASGTLNACLNLCGASSGGNTKLAIGINGTNGNAAYANYWSAYRSGTNIAGSNVPVVTGSTVMLVARIYYGVGTNKDEVDLYVNPPAALSFPATPSASLRNLAVGTIDRVQFQGRRQTTGDELSIGTDWISAVMPSIPAPVISSTLAASGTIGFAFNYQIVASNSPTIFNASGLPLWLSFNSTTGLISGTPTASGTLNATISASNAGGSGSATLIISIISPYKAWLQTQGFTAAELSNPAISGGTATPAGDGISNLMKYALNLNPKANGVTGLPTAGAINLSGSNYLTLSYTYVKAATDISYLVEVSSDLVNWSSGPAYTAISNVTDNGATETITVQDLTPLNSISKRFMRLKVTQP